MPCPMAVLAAKDSPAHAWLCRFFGGGGFPGFGGFGGMGDEEEVTPKGHDVHVDLEVTLKDLYLGHQFKVCNIFHTVHKMMTADRGMCSCAVVLQWACSSAYMDISVPSS